jgi:shikimate kinase
MSALSGKKTGMQALVLVGFMGAGKTSLGRALARQLGWGFEDLDDRVERRERRKVHEIFDDSGEGAFRRVEHAALRELLDELGAGARKIVALGGGAFVQERNFRLIEAAGVATIFLDAPVEELWRRCREQADRESAERPLLRSLTNFRELHDARRPRYLRASFRQETGGKTVDEIVADLLPALNMAASGSVSRTPKARR